MTATPPVPVERAAATTSRVVVAALACVGAVVCALAVAFVAQRAPPNEAATRGVLELLVIGAPLAAGIYAVGGRHDVRFGAILAGTGVAWAITALAESPESVPYSIGRISAWLVFPWLIYLMLAFPDGRIGGRFEGGLLVALNAVLVVLYVGSALLVSDYPAATPWATCGRACPENAFMVPATEPAIMQSVVRPARELLAVLLFVGVTVSMARRWRAAPPFRRRVMGPVMLASGASVILLTAFFVARRESPDSNATTTLGVLWSLCIPAMAGAFFVGLLQRRLLLGQVLAPLGTLLSDQADTRQLRDAIASALDDPQLEVLVPDTPGHWRDSRGRVGDPATASAGGRNVTMIGDHGTPGIVVVHDRQLAAGDEIVRAVGALALAGLRNERMNARLTASLAELETSRRRIAHAADRERARIERDLHDGAQQHLIALRVRLSLVEDMLRRHPGADAGAGAAAMVELGFEVDRTLDELRSLAHGVYPSMLRDRGLADALRGVAAHAPLPVRVQALGLTRHPPEIDTAVYFTCLEALQNAIKHAPGAKSVRITLRENSVLALEVRDDGPGFESGVAEACSGAGLRNMRDRIEAVGGRLTIESAPGQGTRILAWVPLG